MPVLTLHAPFVPWVAIVLLLSGHATGRDIGLHLIPVDGTEAPKSLTGATGDFYGSPCWSPDGKTIAYDVGKKGETIFATRLATIPAEGGHIAFLGLGAMPCYSPDGRQLVCHTYAPNEIVVMNTDGTGREVILRQWGSPRWTNDGRYIITAHSGGGVARYDLATGKQDLIVGSGLPVFQGLSVSPNGKRVCFPIRNQGIGVSTQQDDGSFRYRLRVAWASPGHSSWFPDSKRVLFAGRKPGVDRQSTPSMRLYTCHVDDDAKPIPVPGIPADWDCCDPALSPDGKRIVFKAYQP